MLSSKKLTCKGTVLSGRCFSKFMDLRYSQSCWYFQPSVVKCCHSNLLPGSILPSLPSPFPSTFVNPTVKVSFFAFLPRFGQVYTGFAWISLSLEFCSKNSWFKSQYGSVVVTMIFHARFLLVSCIFFLFPAYFGHIRNIARIIRN
jgi:hypothetical protein